MAEPRGLIFDVQGHSVHDGPGCRTLVFLSGCPLRCRWCCNPEGLLPSPRLMFRDRLCASCPRRCVAACPHGAIVPVLAADGTQADNSQPPLVAIERSRCGDCSTFDCVTVCYRQALQVSGRSWTVAELMRVLLRDQPYWGAEGGVTFSGGEPLGQLPFLREVLERCCAASMHAAVETSGHVPTARLLSILPFVNWLFVDLKHSDAERHVAGTGVPNTLVLENLAALARAIPEGGYDCRLVVRTTIVPGFNDGPAQARQAADLLRGRGVREVNLLPFHRLGASKYAQLGLTYGEAGSTPPADALLEDLASIYREAGLDCYLAHLTPF